MHAAYLSLQAASVQQPDECTFAAHAVSVMGLLHMLSQLWDCCTCCLSCGTAAHAVSILAICSGGGQENRGGRVRELEGQLEEVRSHYHHKLRSLEHQLQVITGCYMAVLPHQLAPHQCQA